MLEEFQCSPSNRMHVIKYGFFPNSRREEGVTPGKSFKSHPTGKGIELSGKITEDGV